MEKKLTPRVINEVYQIIEMLPNEDKEQIPQNIREYFKKNANEIDRYPVDKNKDIDEQNLDEYTYAYVYMLMKYISSELEYQKIEPNWETVTDIKEKVKQLEIEIETNFFNVNNVLADRKLEKIDSVLNLYYYGLTSDQEKLKKLQPFIALCKVFIIMHNDFLKEMDYNKTIEQYKFVSEQLKLNIKRVF